MYSANPYFEENGRDLYNDWAFAFSQKSVDSIVDSRMDFLEKHILKHLPKGAQILDVGCGKGEVAKKLLAKGYQVTGLDISEEMLRYAGENAPSGEFIRNDIRFFELPPTFHAVISTINVFGYILSLEDLTKAFYNVYSALLENGWFGFDLIEGERVADDGSSIEDGFVGDFADDYAWLQRSVHTPDGKSCQVKHVSFRLLNGNWQRSEVNFAKKGYSRAEVQSALEKVGFTKVEIIDLTKDVPINILHYSRIIYIFRKS